MSLNASHKAAAELRGITVWRLGGGVLAPRERYSLTLNSIYEAAKIGAVEFLKNARDQHGDEAQWKLMLEWEDAVGRTPLLIAVERQHLRFVQLLLEAGANVDHISRQKDGGNTALHSAFSLPNCRQMVRLLMNHGADPFLENNGGYTPWDICRQKKRRKESEELAKQAILHGRFQVKDGDYLTSPKSREGLELRLFAYYKLCRHGQRRKELSALRLLIYKRRILNVVYDIDLMDCDARIVSKTETECLIHLTCPMHCIEEWNGSKGSLNLDCTFSELYIKGKRECSEKLMEIIHECQDDESRTEEDEVLSRTDSATQTYDDNSAPDLDTSPQGPAGHPSHQQQHIDAPDQSSGTDQAESGSTLHQTRNQAGNENSRNDCAITPSSTERISEDSRCVICLEKPRSVGFVHGNSMHICVCQDCAQHFARVVDRCPLCRQTIHHIVKQIYTD